MPFHVPLCYQCEEKKLLDDLITNGIEEGMEVRGVSDLMVSFTR